MKTSVLAWILATSIWAWANAQEFTLELPSDCNALLNMEVSETIDRVEQGIYDIIFCWGNWNPEWVNMQEAEFISYWNITQTLGENLYPHMRVWDQTYYAPWMYIGRWEDENGTYFYLQTHGRVWFRPSVWYECYTSTQENMWITECHNRFHESTYYSDEWYISIGNEEMWYEYEWYVRFQDIWDEI